MAKWQRWERRVRRRSYKALPPPFRIRGFLGNHSHDLRLSEFSATARWAITWAFAQPQPISPICYGSLNIHRLLHQPLWLSNYYCTTITLVFSP